MALYCSVTLGGKWKIYDPESKKRLFQLSLKLKKDLGAKIN